MKIRIPARTTALTAALVVGLAGCSTGDAADPPVGTGEAADPATSAGETSAPTATPTATATGGPESAAPSTDARFAVFPDGVPAESWGLTERYEVPEGGPDDDRPTEPTLDWSTEFRGPGANPNVAPFVSVAGHTASLAERRELQAELGREVTEGKIEGREAFWATDPEDVEGGSTVAIAFRDGYTIELSGSGLSLDTLREYAAALEPATAEEWAAAGGTPAG